MVFFFGGYVPGDYYGTIPSDLLHSDLPDKAKLLFCEITARSNSKMFCWGKREGFADVLNCSRSTVYAAFKSLEDYGAIRRADSDDGHKIYVLIGSSQSDYESSSSDPTVQPVGPKGPASRTHKESNKRKYKKNSTVSVDFETFYLAYPKKRKKPDALRAFNAATSLPPIADLISTLERWKQTEDWTKEAGRYVPYPATWIRAQGWLDDLPTNVADQRALELEEILSGI